MRAIKITNARLIGTLISVLVLGCVAGFNVEEAHAANFFNCGTSEPTINSSPNTLFCDDIEDGDWIVTNADTSGGVTNPANDGWRGGIYVPWPDPLGTGYGRCGGKGAAGTNCTSTGGIINCGDSCGGVDGKHEFGNPDWTSVTEIYIREYIKYLAGFVPGHVKNLTIQNDSGYQACLSNFPAFGNWSAISIYCPQNGGNLGQNLGNGLTIIPGHWYYHEIRLTLDSPATSNNGVYEMWLNDCGTSGTACVGTPTKRASHTGLNLRSSASENISLVWFESWANPGSVGEIYKDQFVASRAFIGFAGGGTSDVTPPSAPTNLRIH